MLSVSDDLMIGRGHKRLVFAHPTDTRRCLKVLNPANLPSAIRNRKSWVTRFRPLHTFDNNYVESREYERLVRKGIPVSGCFPVIHGTVATNRGRALVQDLVRDADGSVSLNLQAFLVRFASEDKILIRLRTALTDFTALLLSTEAVVHDLHPLNIVVQQQGGSFRLLVIDGLGTHSVLPFLYRLPGLVRRRMMRKLDGMLRNLPVGLPGGNWTLSNCPRAQEVLVPPSPSGVVPALAERNGQSW